MKLDPRMLQGLLSSMGGGTGTSGSTQNQPYSGGPFDNLSGVSLDIAGRQYADQLEGLQRAASYDKPIGQPFGIDQARADMVGNSPHGMGPGWKGYFGAVRAKSDSAARQGRGTKYQYGE